MKFVICKTEFVTFAEGCGDSQRGSGRSHTDSAGATDGSLLPVHHQNNPNTHTHHDAWLHCVYALDY